MTERVRAGVVGVGHLGALHAAKYRATGGARLVGVYDPDHARAAHVASLHSCTAFATLAELLGEVDCASIAASTAAHHAAASEAIARGVHVLVEKPLAASLADATSIVEAASRAGVLLQVGHLERFNPAFADLPSIVGHPRFIECHRLAPFAGRGVDTDVVFDVMIHDLDLISFVVGRPLLSVEAIGVPVLSDHADIANARLRFEGGCIANVTASRVSLKRERRLRIVRRRAGAGPIDLNAPMESIEVEERTFAEDADPLRDEIAAFVAAVRAAGTTTGGDGRSSLREGAGAAGANRDGAAAAVSGREALVALEIAERVRVAVASESVAGAAAAIGTTVTAGTRGTTETSGLPGTTGTQGRTR